jgi:hypothetical protein
VAQRNIRYVQSCGIENIICKLCNAICIAKITVKGMKVGNMYREEPPEEMDSGW